jgi:cobalt-zinc-cadmium efflux system membrane fusion protein
VRNACLALVLMAGTCFGGAVQGHEDLIRLTDEQIQHIGLRTAKPEATSQVPLLRAPARVSLPPHNEYMVSATQAGLIIKVEVPIGVKVKAGQVLAQIQSPALLGLEREVLDAMTGFNLARAKLTRDRTLLDEGIIARMRYQETQSDFERAATALREAEQVLAAAGMSAADINTLKSTRRLTSTLNVRSSIDGVVLERLAVVGQRVDLLAPLFRIGKLSELWLEIDMPQERMGEIRMGDRVLIENFTLNARITHISQNVDPATQSVLVRGVIESKGMEPPSEATVEGLRPGQHVNVQLMHASTDKLFRLPISSLISEAGKDYVFVRVAGGFAARPVDVASREEHRAVIHGGLDGSEEVVVQGVAALKARWVGIGSDE